MTISEDSKLNDNVICARIVEFDSAHRLVNHEGKCAKLHGHRYRCELQFRGKKLDSLGRVIDFGFISKLINPWIENNFDHNLILHKSDKNLGDFMMKEFKQKVYYMDANPTAENIGLHLLKDIIPKLMLVTSVECSNVKLWETPNCFAQVSL